MAVQGISLPNTSISIPTYTPQQSNRDSNGIKFDQTSKPRTNVNVASEYYSSQKYALEYTSKDGDKVSFSFEAIEYNKNETSIDSTNPDDIKKISSYLKDQLKNMSQEIVKNFLKDTSVDTSETQDTQASTTELKIPEYWNAENTSQRIVDFATSFYDAFKGKGDEFLSKIKAAVEDGFKQAKEFFGGKIPNAASSLVNDTHDLIMAKFDKWAQEKGISPNTENAVSVGV